MIEFTKEMIAMKPFEGAYERYLKSLPYKKRRNLHSALTNLRLGARLNRYERDVLGGLIEYVNKEAFGR